MAKFIIEQYELHSQKYAVEADNKVEAIKALFDGQADVIDNGMSYIAVAHDYSQPGLFTKDELDKIDIFSAIEDNGVTSIRSINIE